MIVVDASALLAILEGGPDAAKYATALAEADGALISAATLIEAKLQALVQEAGIEVESVSPLHVQLAIEAFALYGKGRQTKAGLNYGAVLCKLPLPQLSQRFSQSASSR